MVDRRCSWIALASGPFSFPGWASLGRFSGGLEHVEAAGGDWPGFHECVQAAIGLLGGDGVSLEKWRVKVSIRES